MSLCGPYLSKLPLWYTIISGDKLISVEELNEKNYMKREFGGYSQILKGSAQQLFSHCYYKILDKIKLKKEEFNLDKVWRLHSIIETMSRCRGRSVRQLATLHPETGSEERWILVFSKCSPIFLFIQPRTKPIEWYPHNKVSLSSLEQITWTWIWRVDAVVKSASCSFRGFWFNSQHSHSTYNCQELQSQGIWILVAYLGTKHI